ncbi:hypothetical protein C5L14_07960 [Labrys okinawensis]|uniref:Uncharacterized protein n=1 Tax=Labrys okinawensis TaxID=346911 RepID=A0A2S9QEQ0_9HYPH|nr:hypothetical protein [Labrys okinawensis]PRH87838.1 hypothetical protein C5L14_07960 [Labrys okinawensis]
MGFFQLFIDRHLDIETIKSAIRHYFGSERAIAYFASKEEMYESWGAGGDRPLDVRVVIAPLSKTYPLLLDVWQPGPDSLEEERRFAIYFSKTANCRSIITDEELNPYSWYCVDPSGQIETVYLTDADMGVKE